MGRRAAAPALPAWSSRPCRTRESVRAGRDPPACPACRTDVPRPCRRSLSGRSAERSGSLTSGRLGRRRSRLQGSRPSGWPGGMPRACGSTGNDAVRRASGLGPGAAPASYAFAGALRAARSTNGRARAGGAGCRRADLGGVHVVGRRDSAEASCPSRSRLLGRARCRSRRQGWHEVLCAGSGGLHGVRLGRGGAVTEGPGPPPPFRGCGRPRARRRPVSRETPIAGQPPPAL